MKYLQILTGRRMRILKLLGAEWKRGGAFVVGETKMSVLKLEIKLRDSSQSSISQDLKRLREAGLVSFERNGVFVYYSLSEDFMERVKEVEMADLTLRQGKSGKLVLDFLKENPDSRVGVIAPELDRNTVSKQLKMLRMDGVVVKKKWVYSMR